MGTKNENLLIDFNPDHYYYRNTWFELMRPMTLSGTITPVLVGTGFAGVTGPIRLDIFIALLISALFIQTATNVLNDYYDFKYGQDKEKWILTNDSNSNHGPAHHLLPFVAGLMFIISILIGLWLAFSTTMWVMLAGTLGIAAGFKYSAGSHSFSSIGMGEVVAAIFLGPVITILAYIVQGNSLDFQILAISVPFALLIASMILTNNIRDLKKDIGFRRTLANSLGRKKSVRLLTTLLILPYITVILLTIFQFTPASVLVVVLASPFAVRLFWSFRKNATHSDEVSGMKWAARHHWVFGLLFTIGLWVFG
ncbi:UbiA family prenyltransferase [Virgibacillus ainsalahensis]